MFIRINNILLNKEKILSVKKSDCIICIIYDYKYYKRMCSSTKYGQYQVDTYYSMYNVSFNTNSECDQAFEDLIDNNGIFNCKSISTSTSLATI